MVDAVLSVRNTGAVVGASEVGRLFETFPAGDGDRTSRDGGLGLGLSIVQAIATAHDATVTARAQPAGGLDIVVRFPVAWSPVPISPTRRRSIT